MSSAGRILLVEDHPVNQRVATAMLEHLGFDVDVVADGEAAVDAATQGPHQAILMDCQIPVMDGYQATAEIRRLEGASTHIPIIAVTGSGTSDQQRCLDSGMDDYLTKPLTLKALAAVLDRWTSEAPPATEAADPADVPSVPDAGRPHTGAPVRPVLDPHVVGRLERLGREAGEDLMGQLAVLFLADAGVRIGALREALTGDDPEAVVFAAHALGGASSNLGATRLAHLCATLETEGTAGYSENPLTAIEGELGQVRSALGLLTGREDPDRGQAT
jgi:two-component system, sensor histidine kinase and response regulator